MRIMHKNVYIVNVLLCGAGNDDRTQLQFFLPVKFSIFQMLGAGDSYRTPNTAIASKPLDGNKKYSSFGVYMREVAKTNLHFIIN